MRRLLLAFVLVVVLLLSATPVFAAVDLLYFIAVPGEDRIILTWETAQELDNAGFYIVRSTSSNIAYDRISNFIPIIDPFTGNYYEYPDTSPEAGVVYYYKLEAVDAGGNSTFYGPVSASTTAKTPTQTLTSTSAFTEQPSATSVAADTAIPTNTESVVNTPTPTVAIQPSVTATGFTPAAAATTFAPPKTYTPMPSLTSTPTPSLTPTTTLMPLPEVKLAFPAQTDADIPEHQVTLRPSSTFSAIADQSEEMTALPRAPLLILVLVFLWILLASFIVIYFRYHGR